MARIPVVQRKITLPGAQGLPQFNTGALNAAARGVEQAANVAVQELAAREEARQVRQANNGLLEGTKALNDLQLDLEQLDDSVEAERQWTEEAARIREDRMAGLDGRVAQERFAQNFDRMAEGKRLAVRREAFRNETATARGDLDALGEALARDAAKAGNAAERQAAVDTYMDAVDGAVAAGYYGEDQGQALKQRFAGDVAEVAALESIERDPRAALELLKDDDNLAALDPARRVRLRDTARARIAAMEREARARRTEFKALAREGIAEIERMTSDGFLPDPEFLKGAREAVEAAGDATLGRRFNSALRLAARMGRLKGATPDELQTHLNRVTAKAAREGVTPARRAEIAGTEKMLNRLNTELARDPLSLAARQGVVEVAPLDVGQLTPDALQARIRAGDAAAEYYGTRPRYLTDEEAGQLVARVREAPPDEQARIAGTIAAGAGPQKAGAIFRDVAKDDPIFAHAGGLMAMGDRFARTARDALTGRKALRENPDLRPDPADTETLVARELGNALSLNRESRGAIVKSAEAIYAARVEPGTGFDGEVYRRALQEAAGAWFDDRGRQWGGVTSYRGVDVVAPPDIRADRFERVIRNLGFGDLTLASGNPGGWAPVFRAPDGKVTAFKPDDLDDVWLVNVGGGRYVLSQTRPGRGELELVTDAGTGAPYVLDLNRIDNVFEARGGQPGGPPKPKLGVQ